MSKSPLNIQDGFLNQVRREQTDVSVHLTDGSEISGIITAFDSFTVVLQNEAPEKQYLIYKHAIATISPAIPVRWNQTAPPPRDHR